MVAPPLSNTFCSTVAIPLLYLAKNIWVDIIHTELHAMALRVCRIVLSDGETGNRGKRHGTRNEANDERREIKMEIQNQTKPQTTDNRWQLTTQRQHRTAQHNVTCSGASPHRYRESNEKHSAQIEETAELKWRKLKQQSNCFSTRASLCAAPSTPMNFTDDILRSLFLQFSIAQLFNVNFSFVNITTQYKSVWICWKVFFCFAHFFPWIFLFRSSPVYSITIKLG